MPLFSDAGPGLLLATQAAVLVRRTDGARLPAAREPRLAAALRRQLPELRAARGRALSRARAVRVPDDARLREARARGGEPRLASRSARSSSAFRSSGTSVVERALGVPATGPTVTPFIYVDDDLSMSLGRTVFGWPKTLASADADDRRRGWRTRVAPVTQATVEHDGLPEAVRREEARGACLPRGRAARPDLELPASLPIAASPFAPWADRVEPRRGGRRARQGCRRAAQGPRRHADERRLERRQLHGDDGSDGAVGVPAAAEPQREHAQPQAVPAVEASRAVRLPGADERADAAHVVQPHGHPRRGADALRRRVRRVHDQAPPVAVAADRRDARPGGLEALDGGEEVGIVELEPVLPFWYDVNMEYLTGSNVVSPRDDGIWHEDSTGRRFEPARQGGKVAVEEKLFNTTLSSTIDSVAGPFVFTEASIRVLPAARECERS